MIYPSTQPATTSTPAPAIQCGEFWPAIPLVDAREQMRIDGTVTDQRLRAALIEAAASVNAELATWRRAHQGAGITELAQVDPEQIDGKSVAVHRWFRAVHCFAGAILAERYRGFDSSGKGDKRAEVADQSADDLRRDGRWAIADLQSKPRTVVELI